MLKKIAIVLAGTLIATFTVTGCGATSSKSIDAYIFLYDISGSAEMTSYSPLDRRDQLLARLATSYSDHQALYFDFIRRDAGRQQVTSLISPTLYIAIDEVLDEEINDGGLLEEVKKNLSQVWESLVSDQALADSDKCSSEIRAKATQASNGYFSTSAGSKIASKFCSTVRQALHTINDIPVTAESWKLNGIGSGIQNAVDTAIDKIESEELRIQRRNPEVQILPTIVLTSDFNEVHDNLKFVLVKDLEKVSGPDAACELGTETAGNLEPTYLSINIESDGFGTVKDGHVDGDMREKFTSYWQCWFDARGISDVNIGDRGLDWAML